MKQAKMLFDQNLKSIDDTVRLYIFLSEQAPNQDCSFILRWQFVALLAAMDTYLHMQVRKVLWHSFYYSNDSENVSWEVPISVVYRALSITDLEENFSRHVSKKIQSESYQSPKSIETTMSKLGISSIWTKLGNEMQEKPENLKNKLSLMVNRRNQIAHELDWVSYDATYRAISISDVNDCKNFIISIVDAFEKIFASIFSENIDKEQLSG